MRLTSVLWAFWRGVVQSAASALGPRLHEPGRVRAVGTDTVRGVVNLSTELDQAHYPSFRIVDIHVTARARNFLRRRHKLPTGTARFGYVEVHRDLGVVEVRSLLRRMPSSEISPRAGCGKSARPVR